MLVDFFLAGLLLRWFGFFSGIGATDALGYVLLGALAVLM